MTRIGRAAIVAPAAATALALAACASTNNAAQTSPPTVVTQVVTKTVQNVAPSPSRPKPKPKPAPAPAATSNPGISAAPASNLTQSQQNAVQAAQNYLQLNGFSKQGLIDQLSSSAGDGYSLRDATVAVDSLHVNWYAQAVRSARGYMQQSSFSCQGLIQQLDSSAGDKYTEAQAQYAATKVGLC